MPAAVKKISLGKKISDFKVLNSQGAEVTAQDFLGKKTVLYFYPKDSTPGCTTEGQQFAEFYPKFKKLKVQVFGVSRDSVKSHDKFKCKYEFPFELLSDSEEILCQIFAVIKEKNMYGKKVMGIERSTFILNEKAELIQEFRGIKADGHAAEILEVCQNL